jgi:hypothetical protein
MSLVKTQTAHQLINCTDHDVYVRIGTDLVALLRLPEPRIIVSPSDARDVKVVVSHDGTEPADIHWYDSQTPLGTSNIPMPVPGTWYLVSETVLRRFPSREDFVTAAEWHIDAEEFFGDSGQQKYILGGITRSVDPKEPTGDLPPIDSFI